MLGEIKWLLQGHTNKTQGVILNRWLITEKSHETNWNLKILNKCGVFLLQFFKKWLVGERKKKNSYMFLTWNDGVLNTTVGNLTKNFCDPILTAQNWSTLYFLWPFHSWRRNTETQLQRWTTLKTEKVRVSSHWLAGFCFEEWCGEKGEGKPRCVLVSYCVQTIRPVLTLVQHLLQTQVFKSVPNGM